ncbi:hypothetical protein D3C71_1814900 [compost metagenome]
MTALLRQVNSLVDGGMRRNPVQIDDLVQTHAKQTAYPGLKLGDAFADELVQHVIQCIQPGQCAVDKLCRKSRILPA